MEIRLYFQMLQRGWWIILLVAIMALAVSLGISYTAIPQYNVVARFIITPGASLTTGRDVVSGLRTLDRGIVATYVEIMNSRRILSDSLSSLNVSDAVIRNNYTILAVELPDSSVIELNVSGPDPKLAADLANTIGNTTISFARSLNTVYVINILDTAIPAEKPFSPQPVTGFSCGPGVGVDGGRAPGNFARTNSNSIGSLSPTHARRQCHRCL